MSPPDDPQPPRDYDVPCVWHPAMEFDMAADQDLRGIPVLDRYSLCAALHPAAEFDAAADCVVLTVRYDPVAPPPNPAQDLVRVALALDQLDRSLGGCGLVLDPTRGAESPGQTRLVLRPAAAAGASERLRRMADALNGPPEAVTLQPSAGRQETAPAGVAFVREAVRRHGIQLRFIAAA